MLEPSIRKGQENATMRTLPSINIGRVKIKKCKVKIRNKKQVKLVPRTGCSISWCAPRLGGTLLKIQITFAIKNGRTPMSVVFTKFVIRNLK